MCVTLIGMIGILAARGGQVESLANLLGVKLAQLVPANRSKPICGSPVNPNVAAPTDCIPQHLANLPTDPGKAGMDTLEGIDSDKDGLRDDVQRFITLNYGHSERAVQALRAVAKGVQQEILIGGDIAPDDAKALAEKIALRPVSCFVRSVEAVDPAMLKMNG